MNQSKSFVYKVIYIALIGGLIVPLSLVSRPATRDANSEIADPGGVLSKLRVKYDLSQAKIGEIDAGGEAMKLVSLGLRGLAVSVLWNQAITAKEQKEWDVFAAALNSIVKLQPNFIKVWEYQGHNLSYNVAVEFDDYEQRYQWVKKGIQFLTKGIPYNRRDHRIFDNLGRFTGQKIGTADERIQYRALFRNDRVFHDEMSQFVEVDRINTPYGPDNWLLAYELYGRSIDMVDNQRMPQYSKDMLFYQKQPSQLRNMGLSLYDEYRPDEFQRSNWKRAHEEWLEYGNRPLRWDNDKSRPPVALERLLEALQNIQNLRRELDELVPGARKQLLASRTAILPPEDVALLERPIDSLTDEELARMRQVEETVYRDDDIDGQVADLAPLDKQREVAEILKQLNFERYRSMMADSLRDTINYDHWRDNTWAESTLEGWRARQLAFDASDLKRRSLLDEYVEREPVFNVQNVKPGAIQLYEDAFDIWAGIVADKPGLRRGPMMDDITEMIRNDYIVVREASGKSRWPDEFVLQDVIDYRFKVNNFSDDLPTSEQISEEKEMQRRMNRLRLPERPDIGFTLNSDASGDSDDSGSEATDQ